MQGVEDWTDALVASEGEPDWEDVEEDLELLLARRQQEERGLWREQELCGDGLSLDAEDLLERVDHLIEEELTRCTTRELLGASEHEAHLNRLRVHEKGTVELPTDAIQDTWRTDYVRRVDSGRIGWLGHFGREPVEQRWR